MADLLDRISVEQDECKNSHCLRIYRLCNASSTAAIGQKMSFPRQDFREIESNDVSCKVKGVLFRRPGNGSRGAPACVALFVQLHKIRCLAGVGSSFFYTILHARHLCNFYTIAQTETYTIAQLTYFPKLRTRT
jgi:hypothetical protein